MTRDEFIRLVAESTHNQWVIGMKRQGWHFHKFYEEKSKRSPKIRTFVSLDPKDQEYCFLTATVAVDLLLNTGYISDIEGIVPNKYSRVDLIWQIDKMRELMEKLLDYSGSEYFDETGDVSDKSLTAIYKASEMIAVETTPKLRGV